MEPSRRLLLLLRQALPFALVGAGSILLVGVLISGLFKRHYIKEVHGRLSRETQFLGRICSPLFALPGDLAEWPARVEEWQNSLAARVTIIDTAGSVIADSRFPGVLYPDLDNHGTRLEIIEARSAEEGSSVRYSSTLEMDLLYVARKVSNRSGPLGYVRLAVSMSSLAEEQERIGNLLVSILAITIILVVLVSAWISSESRSALARLAGTAARLSGGDWEARVPIDPYRESDEYSEVAHAFNRMADEVQKRYNQRRRERDQLRTVLANMSDGVLAVDGAGTIRLVNRAFEKFFPTVIDDPIGHPMGETFRCRDLNDLIERLTDESSEDRYETEVATSAGLTLVLHGARIMAAGTEDVRCVIVASDITARRRDEQVRRDLVANVSHELRTPLTSILGYLEALRDPAGSAESQREFLETISRNAARMNAIVSDLLELSRIEAPDFSPDITRFSLQKLATELEATFAGAITQKNQRLKVDIEEGLDQISADREATARILSNLIDNAHKYSPPEAQIEVTGIRAGTTVVLTVIDNGIGVPEPDQPRLFERFFRVSRDRSRESGGTGLGLAIVKHLVERLGGSVQYRAHHPQGSRFEVRLPDTAV